MVYHASLSTSPAPQPAPKNGPRSGRMIMESSFSIGWLLLLTPGFRFLRLSDIQNVSALNLVLVSGLRWSFQRLAVGVVAVTVAPKLPRCLFGGTCLTPHGPEPLEGKASTSLSVATLASAVQHSQCSQIPRRATTSLLTLPSCALVAGRPGYLQLKE